MASSIGTVWRISPRPGVLLRQIDEELLLFDPHTWRTHLLNRTASDVVRLMRNGVVTVEEVSYALAPGDVTLRREVESLLEALADLGVVERVASQD